MQGAAMGLMTGLLGRLVKAGGTAFEPRQPEQGMAMTPYRRIFTRRHAILPVIHVETEAQAVRNAQLARRAGCDGVFLINHGPPAAELLRIHRIVAAELPDWWIGVNCLDLPPDAVFAHLSPAVAGV
jgi:hypothetical protein